MKITIYELLGMVKDGKAPKKIIGKNSMGKKEIYIYNDFWYIHNFENPDGEEDFYYMDNDIKKLNDEVEILEEEKKIPEKLKWNEKSQHNVVADNTKKTLEHLLSRSEQLKKNINEIIDYLKSKGE